MIKLRLTSMYRDYLLLAALVIGVSEASGQTIYEAENATLSGPSIASANGGYSGTGYADYNNATADYVEFTLLASSAGTYPVAFRYANGSGSDRPLQLAVNGNTVVGSLGFPATASWATWAYTATNNVTFNAGLNSVRITATGSSGGNVDSMLVTVNGTASATTNTASVPLRRPISPGQPMWLVHIDTWNYADPQKIINLVPADIRPYVVMNISLSISHDTSTPPRFQVAEYGYEVARSWVRACAENRMWCMIQQASGGMHQFSEFDLSVYEEFFRDYPNFIGFNYAEQFWGFDSSSDPVSAAWTDRIALFANLLALSHKYGGYLVVSWCGNQYDANINPIGMLKRNPAFAAACRDYTENYILEEKYTQQSYQSDMESVCLGAYLSGYSGQYGIRYDSTGWTDATGVNQNFTLASGGAPHLEHIMLTGQTVIDAPELIWQECFQEISAGATDNGYTMRRWQTFPQFDNVSVDLFRKVLDGTVRIPTRREVIDRTKVVIINDVSSGSIDDIYSSPTTLFEGLYRMDGDGNLLNNKTFFKKTGRYPTVPTVYQLDGTNANSFQVKVNKSAYSTRWPTLTAKTNEFNSLFPSEYTGDLYVGRHENGWVAYNPYKSNLTASASIPFKYNTCDHMDLTFSRYTSGVIKEYSNSVTFYLCNYQNDIDTSLKTDTISIFGSTNAPSWSYVDRGSHQASTVTSNWSAGVFTLTVQHNGSLDITVNCSGAGTGRLTNYTAAALITPSQPLPFPGPRQYEAECFDYKNISGITSGGYSGSIRNYTGQGYLQFGTGSAAAVRDSVSVLNAGTYSLQTKYAVIGQNISTIDLYVNGVKVATPLFTQTGPLGEWATNKQNITLNAGANTIEFRANAAGASSMYFDNIVVAPTAYGSGLVIQENQPGFAGLDGTIKTNQPGYTGAGFADTYDTIGASVYWSLNFDSSIPKSFTIRYASTNARTADLIVGGTNVASNLQFPSTGSWTNWGYLTVYASVPAGNAIAQLRSAATAGLPNLDNLEVTGAAAWGWLGGTVSFVPLGLSATPASTSQIDLNWSATQGADSYSVKRATVSGGPYTTIASNVVATGYSDTGLATLATYYYVVSAVNATGESANSAQVNATTLTASPPAAPNGLSAIGVSFNQVGLSWTASPGANNYIVKRSISSGGPYATVAVGVTGTSCTDTALFAATTYYYVVSAVNGIGASTNSIEASTSSLSTGTVEPLADAYVRDGGSTNSNFGTATSLAVKYDGSIGSGFNRNTFLKFDLTGLADAQSFQLRLTPYQVDGAATLACELVTDDTWTETDITWNNQPAASGAVNTNMSGYAVGQPRNVNVTSAATNEAAGDGILSLKISEPGPSAIFIGFNSRENATNSLRPGLVCTFTQKTYPLPATPTDFVATAISSSEINLAWTASPGASKYNVKRALQSGGPYAVVAAAVSGTAFSDTGLAEGTAYFYVISALNGTGESPNSTEAYAMPGSEYQERDGVVSMEAEDGSLGSRWLTGANAGASGGAYIEVDPVYNNSGSAPAGTTADYLATYNFNATTNGNHRFWFRLYSDNASDDSFFWRIDSGSWTQENGRFGIGSWFSTDNTQVDSLSPGDHVLQIAYRENGARLDKFVIQLDSLTAPTGAGPAESSRSFGGAPTIPAGLNATAVSASQIDLSWTASLAAIGYNVKRSTSSGPPYETVFTNVVSTNYSDSAGLSPGTRYYYVVSAVNPNGESGNSAEVSAVPSAAVAPNEYLIAGFAIAGTNLSLTVSNSVPGHDYKVWATDNLTAPVWQPLGVAQGGTGAGLIFNVPVDGRTSRFFKLDVQRQ